MSAELSKAPATIIAKIEAIPIEIADRNFIKQRYSRLIKNNRILA